MIDALLLFIALILLVVAAYTDIRTREVPDWVNISGIIAGLGIRALWGLSGNGWSMLGWGLLGFIVFFALSIIMYYAGQWGGGDSKLLMAMGALLGLEFSRTGEGVSFLLWAILAGAGYGLVCSVYLAVRNWKSFVKHYSLLLQAFKWAQLPALLVFVFGIALAIATDDNVLQFLMLSVGLLAPVLLYTAIGVKAVEKCCMYRMVSPDLLTEGDWIAKPVRYKGKYLCGPKDLGITKKQIRELKRLKIKSVLVRDGVPFVPSFLIAFLLSLWFGSPLQWFF